MNKLLIKMAKSQEDFSDLQKIRKVVFQEGQKIAPNLDFDGLDDTCQHLIADLNGEAVGTVRVRYLDNGTAKIERLAVLPTARNRGIGERMTVVALDLIANQNISQVIVHAQAYIKGLYEKLGFQQEEQIFMEAGILHVKMIKILHI